MSPSMAANAIRAFGSEPAAGNCTAWAAGNGDVVVELGSDHRRNLQTDRYDSAGDLAAAMVDAAAELHDEYEDEQERLQAKQDREQKLTDERANAFESDGESDSSWFSGTAGGWW